MKRTIIAESKTPAVRAAVVLHIEHCAIAAGSTPGRNNDIATATLTMIFITGTYGTRNSANRKLSGKKTASKAITSTTPGTSEITKAAFSYRKCMKYATINADFTTERNIKRKSIPCLGSACTYAKTISTAVRMRR
jgi:uncharacterized alpha/beta hydrolase family protein